MGCVGGRAGDCGEEEIVKKEKKTVEEKRGKEKI